MWVAIKDNKIANKYSTQPSYFNDDNEVIFMNSENSIYELVDNAPAFNDAKQYLTSELSIEGEFCTIQYTVNDIPLEQLKSTRLAELSFLRDKAEGEGFEYQGDKFGYNEGRQTGMLIAITSGAYTADTFSWDTITGETKTYPLDEFLSWYQAGVTRLLTIGEMKKVHEANINALTTADEILAYDSTF